VRDERWRDLGGAIMQSMLSAPPVVGPLNTATT
jgi:hypothetical protein